MTLAAVLVCWATTAHALTPAALSSTTPEAEGATGYAGSGAFGTGWMVTGGYFFKDTMFYSAGRGGPVVTAGRAFQVVRWLGIWVGGGVLAAHGTMDTTGGGSWFRTTFDEEAAWVDVGVVIPWLPIPVSLAVYRHSTDLTDRGVSGPGSGSVFTGRAKGTGLGATVRVLFEYFFSKRRAPHRGLGIAGGYAGFMDLSPRAARTRDEMGNGLDHVNWKPFKGEGLQLGLEYEF